MSETNKKTSYAEKITLLLTKAERTDNDHEREAFFAAAQTLATKTGLDLDVLRYENRQKEDAQVLTTPEVRHIEIGMAGDRGAGTYTDLFIAIAEVNDVYSISTNSWVDAYGMPQDIDYTVAMYNIVVQQMIRDSINYLDSEDWREEEGVTKAEARKAFARAYRVRIARRLQEAKEDALADSRAKYRRRGISTDMVIADKKREVGSMYWKDARNKGTRQFSSGNSNRARAAGDRAATNARFSKQGEVGQGRGITT